MIVLNITPRDDTEGVIRKWSQYHGHTYIRNSVFLIKITWVMVHIIDHELYLLSRSNVDIVLLNVKAALLHKVTLFVCFTKLKLIQCIKYLETKWSCKWTASTIDNGTVEVLGKVACLVECPIATIFVDWSLFVIKQDRKHFRLDAITASVFEKFIELNDG